VSVTMPSSCGPVEALYPSVCTPKQRHFPAGLPSSYSSVIFLNGCSGSKSSGRLNRPMPSEVGRGDTDNLSRYRRRHLNERRQPITDVQDVEHDSDSDVIPPSPPADEQ